MNNNRIEEIRNAMVNSETRLSQYDEIRKRKEIKNIDPNNLFEVYGVTELLEEIATSGLVKFSENIDGTFVPARIHWGDATSNARSAGCPPYYDLQLHFNCKIDTYWDKDFEYIHLERRNHKLKVNGRVVGVDLSLEEALGLALASPEHFEEHRVPSENDNQGDFT